MKKSACAPPRKFELPRSDGKKFSFDRTDVNLMDLMGLLAGVKPVVYTNCENEGVSPLEELSDFFGLKMGVLEPWDSIKKYMPDQKVVLLAARKSDLDAACALARRDQATVDSLKWAALLGYPRCCVRFFQTWRKRDPGLKGEDIIPAILRNTKHKGPIPFYFNNVFNLSSRLAAGMRESRNLIKLDRLNSPLPLHTCFVIPWHPCAYDCEKSMAAGVEIWRHLEKLLPDFASELRFWLSGTLLYLNRWEFAVLGADMAGPKSLLASASLKTIAAGDSFVIQDGRVLIFKKGRRIAQLRAREPVLLVFC